MLYKSVVLQCIIKRLCKTTNHQLTHKLLAWVLVVIILIVNMDRPIIYILTIRWYYQH